MSPPDDFRLKILFKTPITLCSPCGKPSFIDRRIHPDAGEYIQQCHIILYRFNADLQVVFNEFNQNIIIEIAAKKRHAFRTYCTGSLYKARESHRTAISDMAIPQCAASADIAAVLPALSLAFFHLYRHRNLSYLLYLPILYVISRLMLHPPLTLPYV